MIAGLATPAFADTVVATFFDPNSPNGTPNPLANGDPKTNDWGDVVNPGTTLGFGQPGNFDATEPGGIVVADQTVSVFYQNGVIGQASSCPIFSVSAGQVCIIYDVIRGFEEGSFTFSGLPPNVPVQVTVIISDMDYTGVTQDSAGNIPAEEDVLVTGNGVPLGTVTPNGVIAQDQVLTRTFVTLAQSNGSGDLTIGFNEVFRNSVGGPAQGFNDQFGIRVEQISLDFDGSMERQVGGEILSIDSTALLLAGLQSSAIWMLPVLAVATGAGITAFKLRRK
jgi:hypothetical protein